MSKDSTMRAKPPTAAEVRAVAALDGSQRPQVLCRHYEHGTSWSAEGDAEEDGSWMPHSEAWRHVEESIATWRERCAGTALARAAEAKRGEIVGPS